MCRSEPTEADFLRDVAQHEMTILHDAGEFRHIQFKKPGSSSFSFTITTFPGYPVMTGDMGSWVFTRLRDMFEFFRTDPERRTGLYINRGYWAEKLVATDSNGRHSSGCEEYDPDKFRRAIYSEALHLCREAASFGLTKDERWFLLEKLKCVRDAGLDDEGEAYREVAEFGFDHKKLSHPLSICDFFEHNLKRWTYHYTWGCYAIAWAIQQYDAREKADQNHG